MALCISHIIEFFQKIPPEKRWKKVFKWLLEAVLKADGYLDTEPGLYKRDLVYTWFKEDFPIQSKFMRYNTFCILVDKALKEKIDFL